MDEVGDIVLLNCDDNHFMSQHGDVKSMPAELVDQLKKQLKNPGEHLGNRVSKIFLGALVQLIGGYRDGIKHPLGQPRSWDGDQFLEAKAPHIRAFLQKMMQSQLFQQVSQRWGDSSLRKICNQIVFYSFVSSLTVDCRFWKQGKEFRTNLKWRLFGIPKR